MKVRQAGLERKLRKWIKHVKLEGWDIKIRFKPLKEDIAARIYHCSPVEMSAIIDIAVDYSDREGYGVSFNLDTLILHELIHVILWEKWDELPNTIKEHKKMELFEEFVCFHFAKIIYDIKRRHT
jgi:hypothetical protein